MNILILEDDALRKMDFKKLLIGHILTFSENAMDANACLENYDFDIVFLDHDLGGAQMVDPGEINTGTTVARYIAATNPHQKCIIHSFNPIGADVMHKLLPHSIKAPGCWAYGQNKFDRLLEHIGGEA